MKNKPFNLFLIVLVTIVSLWSLWPTWRDYSLTRQIDRFASAEDSLKFSLAHREEIENIRKKSLKLGLDLKGGMHLVMEVDQIDLFEQKAWNKDAKFDAIMARVRQKASSSDASVIDLIVSEFRKENIRLSRYFYDIRNTDREITDKLRKESEDALARAREIIRNRIDQYGVAEPVITTQGSRRLIIELAGISDENRVRNLLKGTAKLEFKLLRDPEVLLRVLDKVNSSLAVKQPLVAVISDTARTGLPVGQLQPAQAEKTPQTGPLTEVLTVMQNGSVYVPEDSKDFVAQLFRRNDVSALIPQDSELLLAAKPDQFEDGKNYYPVFLLRKTAELTGGVITEAKATFSAEGAQPEVLMEMNSDGTAKWARITGANIGKRIAIVLDGAVYSAPVVQSKIPNGNSVINGIESVEEAKDLEIVLKAGALPAPVRILEERTVGPSLGADYIRAGAVSLVSGFLAVTAFMLIYYRIAGFAANAAVVLNILIVLSVLAGFSASLSLPGIAGIVLTIGMAVDANVLIYERIREELDEGKSVVTAVTAGYDKAFSSILDSHVTTLAAAYLLYTFGIGPIQGFAVTLMIGTAASLFTAIIVTKEIFGFMLSRNILSARSFG
ncbi:MAG: protein translocase subunit SecD [Chlorobium sp.]|jgi:SecD/SecF fusion protein|uniref:protein translocase subunit SecD n=1 Tax=Chlorobium sp. TaxID=1095 RepID=UPI001DC03E22|nr:protein translocase subunit SecD [Chlorobium sp.]MBN1278330.1 protein translocase subunit SecD [Chlorobiaceae bacterium]MCF8216892.1 protein translocase subunit SecD [Chlorobium sp.]MCF8271721.1 protein translocase subunit SecD [Chlorobium sp.]MCF8288109.1 protein translocase subunit SecD [Chlorobium sp.]MCF8291700.1 protein translocase subunit SecD [Chlorobium sp.]